MFLHKCEIVNILQRKAFMRLYHFFGLLFCALFYDKQMRPQAKTVTRLPYPFLLNLSLCFETFNDCAIVVSTRTSMYPWKKNRNFKSGSDINLRVSERAIVIYTHLCVPRGRNNR